MIAVLLISVIVAFAVSLIAREAVVALYSGAIGLGLTIVLALVAVNTTPDHAPTPDKPPTPIDHRWDGPARERYRSMPPSFVARDMADRIYDLEREMEAIKEASKGKQ